MSKLNYIANIRLPTEKAHGLATMKMCDAFASRGLEVELIVPRRFNHIKEDPFKYYGVKRFFKITRLVCIDLISFWNWFGFIIETLTFAISAIVHGLISKADIIYGRDEISLSFLSFFKKNIVWEAHTAKSGILISNLLKRAKKLVVISNGLKDYYILKGVSPDKLAVAPSGVDLSQYEITKSKEEIREELSLPLDKKIVSYIGKYKTIGQGKGVDELIEAFKAVSSAHHEAVLLLVGIDKDEFGEIPDYCIVVGPVSPSKTPLYMKASDILVMNYPNTLHYAKYMSPLKLFEYMASGVPILTSNLPSLDEIINDSNANFFEPDNPNDLENKLVSILKNLPEIKEKAVKSLRQVQQYSWNHRAEQILYFIMDK